MMRFVSLLLLLSATFDLVAATVPKRIEKIVYQPYGPVMCRQFCEDYMEFFNYIKEDLSCRRMSGNGFQNVKQRSIGHSNTMKPCMMTRFVPTLKLQDTPNEGAELPKYKRDLFTAFRMGNLCQVKFILYKGLLDINSRGPFGMTPVMIAARYGQTAVYDFLVDMGCDLTVRDHKQNNVLHHACAGGNAYIVKKLIATHQYDVDSKGTDMWTPLMYASGFGHVEVVDILLKEGCSHLRVDRHNDNMLHIACLYGNIGAVKYILNHGLVSIESKGRKGRTPVMLAALGGQIAVFNLLIRKECNLTTRDNGQDYLLHTACIGGNVDIVIHILKLNIFDIDSRGFHGRTPAMIAARWGHKEVVEFLVHRHCNLAATDDYKNSILHLACMGGSLTTVRYILSQDIVDIDSRGERGKTPVMQAAYYGHGSVVEFFVSKKCNMLSVDDTGSNILHLACDEGEIDVVKIILDHYPTIVDSRTQSGMTPLMLAVLKGHSKVVALLISKKCDREAVDKWGNNILHLACYGGNLTIVQQILNLDIKGLNEKNHDGLTPRDLAADGGYRKILSILKSD